MAFGSRSSVFAFIKEDTEGVLKDPTAASFTVCREGSGLTGAVNTTESDELRNSIAASKAFVTSQAPTGTVNHYFKHSGVEGQAPDYGVLLESALGAVTSNSTEYSTVAGSTAGDSTTRANVAVADGEGANFAPGQAMLVKDGANGYAVRNIFSIDESGDPDLLASSFNFGTAPGTGIGLGKAQFYYPQNTGQPTFSAHMYQAASDLSGIHQAEAGCRTSSISIEFNAQDLAASNFEIGGISYYKNPIRIDATNNLLDITDDGGTIQATIESKVYATPMALAGEISAKATAASTNTITCTWDNSNGVFILASDGTTFSLLWNSGAGTATSIGATLGYDVASDDTGATSYTADNEQTYGPSVTPVYDNQGPNVVRDNMLLLGSFSDYMCVSGQALTLSVSTPKTDIPDWCAESGIDESLILEREVTISATLKFKKHDVDGTNNLLNNVTSQLAFVHGEKDDAGNWKPGTVVSVYCPSVSITSNVVQDQDGYLVVQFEGTAIADGNLDDLYINFL